MRISATLIMFLAALSLPAAGPPQSSMPTIRSVEPASGKPGDLLEIQGENLGRAEVAALFLTDGEADIKVTIIEQTAKSIKFKIPSQAKPGRFALMVLTNEKTPKLIEEPVKITVEPESANPSGANGDEGSIF